MEWLRQKFLRHIGPTMLGGVTLPQWARLLARHRFRIGLPYAGRVAFVSLLSGLNSISHGVENLTHGRAIRKAQVRAPLFVLGAWRSGTTHLHNLFSRDGRFGWPNTFQMMHPLSFLHSESWAAPIESLFLPSERFIDHVKIGRWEPQEDEFAIATISGISPLMSFCFWEEREYYNRFLTLADASASEVAAFRRALDLFLRKLTVRYDRPLVLKSPEHTARIRLLLDMYPDARFVTIHRHPYDVLNSARHMYAGNLPYIAFQRHDTSQLGQELVEHGGQLFDAYFNERNLIPSGRLVEVAYEDLVRQPLAELRRVYDSLSLPSFDAAEPAIEDYLQSLSGYRKNRYSELEPELRQLVRNRWPGCFDEWGYESRRAKAA